MIIEDFVMLGRTVPEESKRHGLVVCSAGYSRELRQFMRVYPITLFHRIPRWSTCRIKLKRNSFDCRIESWQLQDNAEPEITGKVSRSDEFKFLESMRSASIRELNDKRRSLGILKPETIDYRFDQLLPGEEYQLSLFAGEKKEDKRPRLVFHDQHGRHDLQLRDWGSHLFISKNPHKHHQLWDALRLRVPEYEHLLFVGNHAQHRTSWLVISLVSEKTNPQIQLFAEGPHDRHSHALRHY